MPDATQLLSNAVGPLRQCASWALEAQAEDHSSTMYLAAWDGCGDGVVSGTEQCDSSDYCYSHCACDTGSTARGGVCVPEPCYLGVDMRSSQHPVDDALVARVAGQLAAQCYATGEVLLVNVTRSTELPAVFRVALVPAQRLPFPGARAPVLIAMQQKQAGWRCLSEVLAAQGVPSATVVYYFSPSNVPGFPPPGPLVHSSSARSGAQNSHASALTAAAVAALALALA
eukprot:m51a1_g965 hypothetical protein (228) ;mRNA; f:360720-366657